MNNFGQLIAHLAKKSGIPDDDQNLIGILSNAELTRVNVPNELFNSIDNRLLSIDDAKNNHPLVKAHYFAQAYNGLDSELDRVKDELGIDDATWQDLQGERSSTKRAVALAKKVKELTEKKSGAEPKAKDALQKQIAQPRQSQTQCRSLLALSAICSSRSLPGLQHRVHRISLEGLQSFRPACRQFSSGASVTQRLPSPCQ